VLDTDDELSFHPDAEKELEEAENYYDIIREELGNRFRAEIEIAISRILDFPNAWQRLSQKTRRRASKTFASKPSKEALNLSHSKPHKREYAVV